MSTLEKILYVEDDPDIRSIAEIALQDIGGFTVSMCGSGREAMDVAAEFGAQLILMDVMMPDMDGPTTLLELRKLPECAETPVIFLTAKTLRHEIDNYDTLGAIATISKPFNPMKLAEQVRQIWSDQNFTS
jgi:two-component system OmpR family response regulator